MAAYQVHPGAEYQVDALQNLMRLLRDEAPRTYAATRHVYLGDPTLEGNQAGLAMGSYVPNSLNEQQAAQALRVHAGLNGPAAQELGKALSGSAINEAKVGALTGNDVWTNLNERAYPYWRASTRVNLSPSSPGVAWSAANPEGWRNVLSHEIAGHGLDRTIAFSPNPAARALREQFIGDVAEPLIRGISPQVPDAVNLVGEYGLRSPKELLAQAEMARLAPKLGAGAPPVSNLANEYEGYLNQVRAAGETGSATASAALRGLGAVGIPLVGNEIANHLQGGAADAVRYGSMGAGVGSLAGPWGALAGAALGAAAPTAVKTIRNLFS